MNKLISLLICCQLLVLVGCKSMPTTQPDVVRSQGQVLDGDGSAAQNEDGRLDVNVLDDDALPITERAFNLATKGDFTQLESLVIYFDFDSTQIASEYDDIVKTHARFLALYPEIRVDIAGHCDERGSPEYNLALGQRRADQVAQYLRVRNVATNQIADIHSFGSNRPQALGQSEEDYAKNRRVEIRYNLRR